METIKNHQIELANPSLDAQSSKTLDIAFTLMESDLKWLKGKIDRDRKTVGKKLNQLGQRFIYLLCEVEKSDAPIAHFHDKISEINIYFNDIRFELNYLEDMKVWNKIWEKILSLFSKLNSGKSVVLYSAIKFLENTNNLPEHTVFSI